MAAMSRSDLLDRLVQQQQERAKQGLLRRLRRIDEASSIHIRMDGRNLVSFASNDYLGLAGHPALRSALAQSAHQWGVGATAAHLLGGHRQPHADLEEVLCDWLQRPRVLLFSTGYMANLGVLSSLLGARDLCVQDKLNHRSLLDGTKLSGCTLKRYRHIDVDAAEQALSSQPDAYALLATDGVFSMDGDVAPLTLLAQKAREQNATFMVDDAHGLGVLGPEGAGSVREAGLALRDVPIYMATLGKALGCFGAFVAGDEYFIQALLQFASSHVYTTAIPPALASTTVAAIRIARYESWRRDKLQILIRCFQAYAKACAIPVVPSRTPIQPILIGSAEDASEVSRALEKLGFYVPAIRPPTVPQGQARLRVSLCALHQECDVQRLLECLAEILRLRAIGTQVQGSI
jgi:8-amino-7-oxononanoate synthase